MPEHPDETACAFMAELSQNNDRAWFAANRERYEALVSAPLGRLIEELASEVGGEIRKFRPYNDARFGNLPPLKETAFGVITLPSSAAGLYVQVSGEGLYAGTGYHRMANDQLARFRAAVHHDGYGEAIVTHGVACGLEIEGRALKGMPRGFRKHHPRSAWLRRTEVLAGRRWDAASLPNPVADACRVVWREARNVVAWLDRHVGPSTIPPEERYGRHRPKAARGRKEASNS